MVFTLSAAGTADDVALLKAGLKEAGGQMSVVGQMQQSRHVAVESASPPSPDFICSAPFLLESAITGPLLVQSITLSAPARSTGGTESPSCLAVLRLMDNSNLVTW